MTVINTTPHRLDMQAWTYLGAKNSQFTQANQSAGEIILRSNFDPYGSASVPQHHTYITALRIRGTGFSDFDANGVPQAGIVTGATLQNNGGFVLFFAELNMPVAQFMAALRSSDPADLRRAFLGGDDQIDGGTYDVLIGAGLGDVILGEAGNDTLNGHGGHDTLDGGPGNDLIVPTFGDNDAMQSRNSISVVIGGDGIDTVDYQFASAAMEINLALGVADQDTLSGIERARGTRFDDRIVGSVGDNELWGGAGADTILGGAGADRIDGADGVDRLSGEAGDDILQSRGEHEVIDGGPGSDLLNYGLSPVGVVVDLASGVGTDTVSGIEWIVGSLHADRITGSAGSDTLEGASNVADTISGGGGNDMIFAAGYLRGDEGDDQIIGSVGFDDINGNMGRDTASGFAGDDWVVGGKDDDLLGGDDGADIVYGNLGRDTCNGGDGADLIRGGQDDDSLSGGAGDDWLSGDRGSDTLTGGAGADIFHTFAEAGDDRVRDFSIAEGDRVMVDPGTIFTVAQAGADTVITMSAGRMILEGVTLSTLPPGWIFGA